MRTLVWFRRDLRVADNKALYEAAKDSTDGVVALFLLAPEQWSEHDDAELKIRFWLDNLAALSTNLAELNIPLLIKPCERFADAPQTIVKLAEETNCQKLFFNREYEANESQRDAAVRRACDQAGVGCFAFHDRVIVPPREITTKDGRFYSVFTPYRKVWDTRALEFAKPLPTPKAQTKIKLAPTDPATLYEGTASQLTCSTETENQIGRWPAGEAEAAKRLKRFTKVITDYDAARDIPSLEGTSRLSPYLAAGVISPRQALAAALKHNGGSLDGDGDGAKTWISELTWRDFYTHVMVGFPRVSKHRPFKEKTDSLAWREDADDLAAWKAGKTGYPIVDAGMRQLNQTGWMHNRLRMVTAMFLTKNLLIDWRLGEKYFMQKLIDGDLAANNGGWQWSASTGTDAVPYFRIFSPFSQSKRFDPEGVFIKQFCPELEEIPPAALHDPKKLTAALKRARSAYPAYVVEYSMSRERALKEFKSLKAS